MSGWPPIGVEMEDLPAGRDVDRVAVVLDRFSLIAAVRAFSLLAAILGFSLLAAVLVVPRVSVPFVWSAGTPSAARAGAHTPDTLPPASLRPAALRAAALALAGLIPAAVSTPIAHPKLMTAVAVRRINTPW
jgi:hypothetical protein